MIAFVRNKDTGILEAYKDGEYVGDVDTIGDNITDNKETDLIC